MNSCSFTILHYRCDACGGTGKVIKAKCPACSGKKVSRGSHEITITVEKGMADGEIVSFPMGGDQAPDITPGDLNFKLVQRTHPLYTRRGDNLYTTATLSLKEALLGFTKTIKQLDGSDVELTRQTVTQPGMFPLIDSF